MTATMVADGDDDVDDDEKNCDDVNAKFLKYSRNTAASAASSLFSFIASLPLRSYLGLAFACWTVVELNVTVPVAAVKSNSVPASQTDGILGTHDARTIAAVKPIRFMYTRHRPPYYSVHL